MLDDIFRGLRRALNLKFQKPGYWENAKDFEGFIRLLAFFSYGFGEA